MKNMPNKKRLGVALAVASLIVGPAATADDVPSAVPWYDSSTGILHLPSGTFLYPPELVVPNRTPSFTDVEINLVTGAVTGTPVDETVTPEIAQGALAYSKYWENLAGGDGAEPAHADYTRCKACHGWDLLGTAGGYVRRGDGGGTRSAAVNIRLDRTDYTATDILNGNWRPGTDPEEQSHPNFSGILTDDQVNNLVAYLNFRDAKFNAIGTTYNAADPVEYTVPFGDASRGQDFYDNSGNCLGCHGAPTETDPPVGGPAGGILEYFKQDGKPSELAHKVRWGEVGTPMTRGAMGNPTSQDVADLIAYLQSLE